MAKRVVGLRASHATTPWRKGPRPFGLRPGSPPASLRRWPVPPVRAARRAYRSDRQGATQTIPSKDEGLYEDVISGRRYWISGPRKDGRDRLYAESTRPVAIDNDVADEYWRMIRGLPRPRD